LTRIDALIEKQKRRGAVQNLTLLRFSLSNSLSAWRFHSAAQHDFEPLDIVLRSIYCLQVWCHKNALLCSRSSRPQYRSCPSVRLSYSPAWALKSKSI